MALREKIEADMKDAMRAKDKQKLTALRSIKSMILMQATSGEGEMSEEEELKLLTKAAKQRKDSLAIYEKEGRDDLAATERAELEVIEVYLPKQMGDDELEAAVKKIIAEVGASSPADMGKVMGSASKSLSGKADNGRIAGLVKKLLST